MDFLKEEIASKRKAFDGPSTSNGNGKDEAGPPAKKYMRKGDLEKMRREEETKAYTAKKEEREKKLFDGAKKVAAAEEAAAKSFNSKEGTPEPSRNGKEAAKAKPETSKPEAFNISNTEAIRRLRQKDQPIRLFAETDKERRLRLRALELIEERSSGQGNDFMRALEGMDKGLDLEELQRRAVNPALQKLMKDGNGKDGALNADGTASESEAEASDVPDAAAARENEPVDLALVKKNPSKVYPQIYFGIKKVLKEWEASMAERPDSVKRSQQGKLAAATQMQSAEYLKPLFKALRKRELEADVLQALAEIVYYMQKREYLRSSDAYLRLSIGNAPWPIGVTMVGIHERSAREKIFSNSVAHVLNDEVSRKYIQSLKRLLTFAQTIRPPDDLSQRMG